MSTFQFFVVLSVPKIWSGWIKPTLTHRFWRDMNPRTNPSCFTSPQNLEGRSPALSSMKKDPTQLMLHFLRGFPPIMFDEMILSSQWSYLVGGLEHVLFSHILGIIIPIDFHIFQRGSNHQPVIISPLPYSTTVLLWSKIPGPHPIISPQKTLKKISWWSIIPVFSIGFYWIAHKVPQMGIYLQQQTLI